MTKLLGVLCLFAGLLVTAGGAENLLISPNPADPLAGWKRGDGIRLETKDNRVSVTIDGPEVSGKRIPMKPEWKYLLLSMRMRPTGLVRGEQSWQNGRLAMRFHDKANQAVGPWPEVFGFEGSGDFRNCRRVYEIPEGAASLSLAPANFGKAGRIEFADMELIPLASLDNLDKDAAPPDGSTREQLWDLSDAWKNTTPTRESISLNGLWNFFPILTAADATGIPAERSGWGYFKVPGIWPGMGNGWTQAGDSNTVYRSEFASPDFKPAEMNSAWYRRTIAVPAGWKDRRIELEITMLQTGAQIFIDGKPAGELFYPGGRFDLTGKVTPGKNHELALLVSAKKDGLADSAFMAPGRLVSVDAEVNNRGITGDVFLTAEPKQAAITDTHILTSVRKKRITFDTGITRAAPGRYYLEADIRDGKNIVKSFRSDVFDIPAGDKPFRTSFSADWIAPKLWDTDAPENLYTADLRLKSADGKLADAFYPQEFGFREFWIDGRNFVLNGSVIHLRSLCMSTMRDGAARSSAAVTAEMARRTREAGFNHLIAYNYAFTPGIVGYQDDFYIQSSKAGILTSLTLPHAKDFKWNLDDPAERARYLAYTEFLIRRFQNLPGVVLYATSHNATGYFGDQNPMKIDGIYAPDPLMKEGNVGSYRNRVQALKAGELIASVDPSRPVYHHESGNLGDVFTINCYLNWAPAQERSDWLEHWEKEGVKPVMMVEWGMPHVASWSSYRGPGFIWRNNGVQCLWLNEFNASLLGENAYRSTPAKVERYQRQEKVSTGNKPIHYSQTGGVPGGDADLVRAEMVGTNFRDLRARGLSGLLPWDEGALWSRTQAAPSGPWPDRFRNLKQPGIVPDTSRPGGEYVVDLGSTYTAGTIGKAGLPYMQELTAWIAGKPGDFTEKGHNFRPGETVEKQIVLLNDTRRPRKAKVEWSIPALKTGGEKDVSVVPGVRTEVPLRFAIPAGFAGKQIEIEAKVRFETGREVSDRFGIDVIPAGTARPEAAVGLYDPSGKSTGVMRELGIPFKVVKNDADLAGVELLVVGREGLADPAIRLDRLMQKGGRLLVLEQEFPVLARTGFRSNEHGLRNFFPLVPEFSDRVVRDWRGSATLTAPNLALPALEVHDPTWNWHGFDNTRVWRAGNRGNVNSVLLEKPTVGNFLPLMQGGFDLQYAPALEARYGDGVAIFSQFDFSGRTENDPEAVELLRGLILRLDAARPAETLPTWYAGNAEGADLLKKLGIDFKTVDNVPEGGLLVVGPGAKLPELSGAVDKGLRVLALGLPKAELDALFPGKFDAKPGKYFSDYVNGLRETPEFLGISNADLHWRKELAIDAFDAAGPGGRALRVLRSGKGVAVALQVAPWMFDANEFQFRTSRKRNTGVVSRLLHNLGAADRSGIWERLAPQKVSAAPELVLTQNWVGKTDPDNKGRAAGWFQPDFKTDSSWRAVEVPGKFDAQFKDLENYDGLFWYRLDFELPAGIAPDANCMLAIGPVDDESWVWLNGKFLGELTAKTNPEDYWAAPRSFQVKGSDLRAGRNQLTVLCNDLRLGGGILGTPRLRVLPEVGFYADMPISSDDPYRYYRW